MFRIFCCIVEAPVRTIATKGIIGIGKHVCICVCNIVFSIKVAELIIVKETAVEIEQIKIALEIIEGYFTVKLNVKGVIGSVFVRLREFNVAK